MNALIHLGWRAARAICESEAVQEFVTETIPSAVGSVVEAIGDVLS